MGLSNRSKTASKFGKNIIDTQLRLVCHIFVLDTNINCDVHCDLSLNSCMATRNTIVNLISLINDNVFSNIT